MDDLTFLPALELGERIRAREVTSAEVTEHFLARIADIDGDLRTYVHVADGLARDHAAAADERLESGNPLSRFDGVPISIKDLAMLTGLPTTLGSKAFDGFIAPYTDLAIQLILDAGMVPLGKTNTSEFGALPIGENLLGDPARNPWNTERTTGGSSAGAGAGLAAGLAPIAQGSDGGGSVRIPAAANGVVGIKPSRGRISAGPMFGETASGLSTLGPLARTVEDAAALLDVMAQPFPGDHSPAQLPEKSFHEWSIEDPAPLKIGWFTEDPVGAASDEMAAPLLELVEQLSSLGHEVEEIKNIGIPNPKDSFLVLWRVAMAGIPVSDPDLLTPVVRGLFTEGREISAVDHNAALADLNRWVRNSIAPLTEAFDAVISPILSTPPPEIGFLTEDHDTALERAEAWMHFNPPLNISGAPAVAIPVGEADGLPVAVQIAGKIHDEATIVSLAGQIERARGGLVRTPPQFS
jgi:amidase